MYNKLRLIENEKHKCPKCGGRTIKFGNNHGKPRRRCEECGYQFTPELYK